MKKIPHLAALDSTLSLALEGYTFISTRCDRYQTDIFQTRLVLQKTICMRGKAAAEVFYDTDKFSRQDAAPKRVQKTLTGEDGVQGLDGEVHRQRKAIFMGLMTPAGLDALGDLVEQAWHRYAQTWTQQDEVILFDEVQEILCQAVCEWSGVPLAASEVRQRTRDLADMIRGSGRIGPAHWQARQARDRAEAWIGDILQRLRDHQLDVAPDTAAYAFAFYKSPSGQLLDRHAAAVDLLNVLRPTVAIGRYLIFAALALHQHPEQRHQLAAGSAEDIHNFVQEVRRFYPFFPFAAARVRHDFDWQGYHFPVGCRVLLDLYGTNHDPDLWEHPDAFHPERFQHWQDNPFDFIPQGGGDYTTNHRCAGEWLTIRLMERSLTFLIHHLKYRVPPQDLSFSLTQLPTLPKSRFRIADVQYV
jgi:fatty-acid peroxygenase